MSAVLDRMRVIGAAATSAENMWRWAGSRWKPKALSILQRGALVASRPPRHEWPGRPMIIGGGQRAYGRVRSQLARRAGGRGHGQHCAARGAHTRIHGVRCINGGLRSADNADIAWLCDCRGLDAVQRATRAAAAASSRAFEGQRNGAMILRVRSQFCVSRAVVSW